MEKFEIISHLARLQYRRNSPPPHPSLSMFWKTLNTLTQAPCTLYCVGTIAEYKAGTECFLSQPLGLTLDLMVCETG